MAKTSQAQTDIIMDSVSEEKDGVLEEQHTKPTTNSGSNPSAARRDDRASIRVLLDEIANRPTDRS
jgi:hypothetical protein